jgi:lipoprotein-anchoring transpeptidase ErfK/SrfK
LTDAVEAASDRTDTGIMMFEYKTGTIVLAASAALGILATLNHTFAAGSVSEPAPVRLAPAVERMWIEQLQDKPGTAGEAAPLRLANHLGSRRRGTTGADIVFGRQKANDRRTFRSTAKVERKQVIDPAYLPATVNVALDYSPGTIVIDTSARYLYLMLEDGKARRYGVGVGRTGFGWTGEVKIGRKAEWPGWRPPAAMRERQPYLPEYMEGGLDNPLGARALYLYKGGNDTIYRIHGSNEPWTIGQAVSSGCFRMRNEDVTELYEQVGVGTRVLVL